MGRGKYLKMEGSREVEMFDKQPGFIIQKQTSSKQRVCFIF
jgi:hypothetical protein